MDEKTALLKEYFGHSSFRPGQEELIDAILSGRDVLGVMPTGAGKSACYQIPAMLLPGITLVISPLISLMKDQVTALNQSGISADCINSSLSSREYWEAVDGIQSGRVKIVYAAPERLSSASFLKLAENMEISLIAVDEAHCVSQWGQDFRPDYLKIAEFVEGLEPRPVLAAFTATATNRVKQDIEQFLELQEPFKITTGFDRPNLFFQVAKPLSKMDYLLNFIKSRPGQCGIVYCNTRKNVEKVCEELQNNGVSAARYHAGLPDEERRKNQEDFVFDRVNVMVATNAFGMGIDKSNVSFVVHYNMPKDIESYYQEAGRAGRDGSMAHCLLLYSPQDTVTAKFMIENSSEENTELSREEKEQLKERDMQRLYDMVHYCKTTGCLRRCLLNYFGEFKKENCGSCGNCCGKLIMQDISVEAQKILSCAVRTERQHGFLADKKLLADILCGSGDEKLKGQGLDKLSTYGIMAADGRDKTEKYIDFLRDEGYLTENEEGGLKAGGSSADVLFGRKQLIYSFIEKKEERKLIISPAAKKKTGEVREPAGSSEELMSVLKSLRGAIAKKENVPAYVVFSDKALAEMSRLRPKSIVEFLQVPGVGSVKAQRYGQQFMARIRLWEKDKRK